MKIFLYLSIIVIMAVSFSMVNSGETFAFVIPFSLVPIVLTGYFYGVIWAYLVSVTLSAFYIGLVKLGLDMPAMFICVASFNIAPVIVMKFNNMFERAKKECKQSLSQAENDYAGTLKEDENLKKSNAQLERDVLDMARLYEITKAMSGKMEFSGIFMVLDKIINRIFKFRRARLILVDKNQQNGEFVIKAVYNIESSKKDLFFNDNKLAHITVSSDDFLNNNAESLQYASVEPEVSDIALIKRYPEPVRDSDLAGVWLFSKDTPMGILSIEGMPPEQIEKFLIIVGQFALELQKVKLYEMVQQLAILDGLTGMFVRRHLLERCQDELRRSIKHKLNLACLMVDIDFFKSCNDKYGHLVGDEVLKQISAIIKDNIREVDFAGRYGGEEFCIVLPDTSTAGAVHVAERLRAGVESHIFKAYDENIKVTVSIGASIFPDDASDLNQIIDCADQAMYKAKADGRNKVCTWKS
ncbi:MAG: hypothetical protein COW11_06690 [Candidatus Omnitrophica bacterium CG12_big_fil_rev_8_21_14_0_65_43_15]|uniref:diguanylate cyclase n=1 Tax=Candidatus Taenaricola geysiri TaxID=1974752 RepID=A0A2J0LPQ2_9BACT|nr:MAG: hypothetical protein AUJ89_03535 [Candidatus Omnitrophica bacterium CG1_02_43_210]PIV11949.1 MAG: hypothetical protein COS48_03380 [Candidatus Omnitrophica bacterium CG03_land_8_20_14_0_80_43_22]PIW65807.1 MAG: hypothetical protein COW11_06690 [Candidatus Omnitrophica bacterium CG12_big_fil_rev_8_21_14_0_65_43_15]PIW80030.1 MAG: hypothetical protein COZ98_04530 [Candidatus Omnitrophica bacterium CG_4_8_14_3_um_filter_43_15]PIY83259.1 MAG: hypothetical protein COY77_05855 [Candidatus Omn